MIGMGRAGGKRLAGDEHLAQSLGDLLTTPIGSRVMRRDYGCDLVGLIDAPANGATFVAWVAAIAEAVAKWEPRLTLRRVRVDAREPGRAEIALSGLVEGRQTETGVVIGGSRAAIDRAIAAMGLGEVSVVEGQGAVLYDGTHLHDGAQDYGAPAHWAEYRVYVKRLISLGQAEQIRAQLAAVQPARCLLAEIVFLEAAALYDGARLYDGTYSHGVA